MDYKRTANRQSSKQAAIAICTWTIGDQTE